MRISLKTACALLLAAFPAWADPIQAVRGGKSLGELEAYRLEEAWYLGAKDAARLYGAGLYWHPVRGQVRLSLKGAPVVFEGDSDKARVGEAEVALPRPVLVRVGKAFIPLEFFSGPEFSALASAQTSFDPATRVLRVEPAPSVGPLRYSSQPGRTRVVLELRDGLGYITNRKGRTGLEVKVPGGATGAPTRFDVRDAAVDFVELRPEARGAGLQIQLKDGVTEYNVLELAAPRRVVVDISHPAQPGEGEAGRIAMEAPPAPGVERQPNSDPGTDSLPAVRAPTPAPLEKVKRRIVIDAGHGGKDSGAPGRHKLYEKDINLKVAKELAALLENEGFEVLQTRSRDVFVPLGERSRMANEFGGDLFISLHCNANPHRSETGYEIYFLSENASDPEAERLAEFENSVLELEDKSADDPAATLLYAMARTEFINDSAEAAGLLAQALSRRVDLANRGVKQASFYVLRGTNSPAVLVEMGFVTNPRDSGRLGSASFRRKLVEGIRGGVLDYARKKAWGVGKGR